MSADRVYIFDTTLRDGEQSPGCSMNTEEKIRMARMLARLKVDVIEAGFPQSSEGDFEAVQRIAREIEGPRIIGLARTGIQDIDRAFEAVRDNPNPGIHTFIATSPIHMEYKLKLTPDEVVKKAVEGVSHARSLTDWVEFSAEDATRSDPDFLVRIFTEAVAAGAHVLNVPDTVGYTTPFEYARLIEKLMNEVKGIENCIVSVHCHNDLGLAVANSLAAVRAGARQVECTVNGIGERAGNCSMEEIAMALKTRLDQFEIETGLDTTQIWPASRLLSQITGMMVQPNKAIVGANAFAHEAGIHQDGVLKKVETYEIMRPESVGVPANKLVLGKHSGRHALRERLKELGYDLEGDALDKAFKRFKKLADKKKEIFDEDLVAMVGEDGFEAPERVKLEYLTATSGNVTLPVASVKLTVDGEPVEAVGSGDGPVDAAMNAIREATGSRATLTRFVIQAVTQGTDAQGEVSVGIEEGGVSGLGHGTHTDIVVASAKAFINALNKLQARRERQLHPSEFSSDRPGRLGPTP